MIHNNIPIRVAVTGITGRMGKEIVQIITEKQQEYSKKIVLGAAISRVGSDICGMDAGSVIKNELTGIIVTDNLNIVKNDFDILIDFTNPDVSIEYLNFCFNNNKNMVIGTTGFNEDHQSFIKNASQKIGIVYSANFSIGINLVLKLLSTVTQVIGNISDINIIEAHHNKKIDTPSGTALIMKDVIINMLSSIFINNPMMLHCNVNKNNNNKEVRCKDTASFYNVPIHSIRAGALVGEHSVLFSSTKESLQITHKAYDRSIFAQGALFAAIWLGYKKGLFNMCDVLDI